MCTQERCLHQPNFCQHKNFSFSLQIKGSSLLCNEWAQHTDELQAMKARFRHRMDVRAVCNKHSSFPSVLSKHARICLGSVPKQQLGPIDTREDRPISLMWRLLKDHKFELLVHFFSVQRLHGFRQVVQHVLLHVANWD